MIILDSESIWTWSHFSFGLVYGITASLLFLFIVLILFKPKIIIAPFLCKANGDTWYVFKFVNVSFFSAHDIKVELHKIRKIPMGGGTYNNVNEKLTLLNGEISHIPKRLTVFNKSNLNPHCITVRSSEDINKILSDEACGILLRVGLKHGLTGLSKVFEREYANVEEIKAGKFKPGAKFVTI